MPNIEVADRSDAADAQALRAALYAFNDEVTGFTDGRGLLYEGLGFAEVGRTTGTPEGFDEVLYQLLLADTARTKVP
jgi:hypothetical protein